MVFFFTGTGNSLYVAKELDEEAISIPQVIQHEKLVFKAEKIGIVAPVYGHELPDMVTDFLQRAVLDTPYLYVIATYGSGNSGAGAWIQQWAADAGKQVNYVNTVLMPDNFLPSFDMAEQAKREKELGTDEQIAAIRKDIDQRRLFISPASFAERVMHRQAVAMKHRVVTKDFLRNIYTISEDCVGCGICSRVCPAGCIQVKDHVAVRTHEGCQLCMACIHACPRKAIHLNLHEPNPTVRFRNSHVTLREIVEANNRM